MYVYKVEEEEEIEEEEERKENIIRDKIPLKLIMNPSGQIRDIYSLKESANLTNTGLLSPEKCAQLVSALQEHKGKGAELFAKRRKKSEKWIVEATPTTTSTTNEATNIADYQQQQQHCQGGGIPYKAPTSPNLLPAYSEAGKHRVQLNLHQEQLLQKYVKPELKVVKTPWEAALETGSASTAFVETPQQRNSPYLLTQQQQQQQQQQQRARSMTPMPTHTMQQQQQLAQQPKPYQPTKQYQQPQQQQQQQQFSETTYDSRFKVNLKIDYIWQYLPLEYSLFCSSPL